MKCISVKVFLLVALCFIYLTFPVDGQSINATEIISISKNKTFILNSTELESILGSDDIKDRYVVVVSIVGPYRSGKSFLLNFLLKYLYAQYKTHNVTKWLDGGLSGFKFRSGRKPETSGIWMWGEVFTHDFDENNKVAIILMDTQGIFDYRTTPKESTTIFALTMMMSSVQCFNIMHNIQEDNLERLELFAKYGRLALGNTVEKPFQKSLFIVRDWNFGAETGYAWAGNEEIETALMETEDQSEEMHQLRRDIKSSFQEINAFLLPSPGDFVIKGNVTAESSDLSAISPNFIKNVDILVSDILDPQNLKVKTINGVKLRARDLIGFLKKYIELFNGNNLPEPTGMAKLMSEVYYNALTNKYVDMYVTIMNDHLKNTSYQENVFLDLHQKANSVIIELALAERKLSEEEHVKYQNTLTQQIDSRFQSLAETNAGKRKVYELEIKERFSQLVKDCFKFYADEMAEHLDDPIREFEKIHQKTKNESIAKFVGESTFGEEEQKTQYKTNLTNDIDIEYESLAKKRSQPIIYNMRYEFTQRRCASWSSYKRFEDYSKSYPVVANYQKYAKTIEEFLEKYPTATIEAYGFGYSWSTFGNACHKYDSDGKAKITYDTLNFIMNKGAYYVEFICYARDYQGIYNVGIETGVGFRIEDKTLYLRPSVDAWIYSGGAYNRCIDAKLGVTKITFNPKSEIIV